MLKKNRVGRVSGSFDDLVFIGVFLKMESKVCK